MATNEGTALRRSAPETSYSPLCKHGRRLEFTGCNQGCVIEYPAFNPDADEAARDRAAGRDETTIADEESHGND